MCGSSGDSISNSLNETVVAATTDCDPGFSAAAPEQPDEVLSSAPASSFPSGHRPAVR